MSIAVTKSRIGRRLFRLVKSSPLASAAGPSRIRAAVQFGKFVLRHPANDAHRWRSLGSAFIFQFVGRVFQRRRLVSIGSHSQMWADVHYGASAKAAAANPPDWNEMLAWRRLLRPGDIFIDVGANIGTYTLWAADLGAQPIAIEPDPAARALLTENLRINGYRAEVLPVAVGAEQGVMGFTVDLDGANHLLADKPTSSSARTVQVALLDDIIGDRTIAGVKIDVEGAESLVLRGAQRALEERRIACLQLEWNEMSSYVLGDDRQSVVELLHSLGYEFFRPDIGGDLRPVMHPGDYGVDMFAKPASDSSSAC